VIISIDFDDTWTQDPEAWREFARMLNGRGHTVLVTTNRYKTQPSLREVRGVVGTGAIQEVIFAGTKPKRVAASERGYDVDVWADDSPEMVFLGLGHCPDSRRCECRKWPGHRRPRGGHHKLCPLFDPGVVG
jgi:hypothetical protein